MDNGQNAPQVQKEREEQQVQEDQLMLRRSTRQSRAPDCYFPSLDYVMLIDCKEPSCYEESMLKDDQAEVGESYAIRNGLVA